MATHFHKSDKDQAGNNLTAEPLMTTLTDPKTDIPLVQDPPTVPLDKSVLEDFFESSTAKGNEGVTRSTTFLGSGYAVAPLNPATPAESKSATLLGGSGGQPTEVFKLYEQDEKNRSYDIDALTEYSLEDPTKKDYNMTNEFNTDDIIPLLTADWRLYIGKSIVGKFDVGLTAEQKTLAETTDPETYDGAQNIALIYAYFNFFSRHFYPQLRLVFFKRNGDNPFAEHKVIRQKPLKYNTSDGRAMVVGSTNAIYPVINDGGEADFLYESLKLPLDHPNQNFSLNEMVGFGDELAELFRQYTVKLDGTTDELSTLYQLWFYKKTKVPLLEEGGTYGTDPWNAGYGLFDDPLIGSYKADFPPYFPDDSTPYVTLYTYASKDFDQTGGAPLVAHDKVFVGPFSKIGALKNSYIRITGTGVIHNREMQEQTNRYINIKKSDIIEGYFPEVYLHPSNPAGHIYLKDVE